MRSITKSLKKMMLRKKTSKSTKTKNSSTKTMKTITKEMSSSEPIISHLIVCFVAIPTCFLLFYQNI